MAGRMPGCGAARTATDQCSDVDRCTLPMVPLTSRTVPAVCDELQRNGREIRRARRALLRVDPKAIPRRPGARQGTARARCGASNSAIAGAKHSVTSSGAPRRTNTEQRAHTSRRPHSVPVASRQRRCTVAAMPEPGAKRAELEAGALRGRQAEQQVGQRPVAEPADGLPRCRAHAPPAAPSAHRPPARRQPAGSPRARRAGARGAAAAARLGRLQPHRPCRSTRTLSRPLTDAMRALSEPSICSQAPIRREDGIGWRPTFDVGGGFRRASQGRARPIRIFCTSRVPS